MGLLDRFMKRDGEAANASKLVADTAADIIKEMSGEKLKPKKKLIDNVVGFVGVSGGVGASTVVTNVAYMLAERGFKVIVMDLNIMYPSQSMAFGINPEIQKKDLVTYLLGKNDLGESIENMGAMSLMYANNQGITSLLNVEEDAPIENFRQAIYRLRKLYDVVLLDIPLQIEHTLSNTAIYSVDRLYMVMDESINSVVNIEKFRKGAAFTGVDTYSKSSVIMNKRTSVHYTDYIFNKLGLELVEVLPFEVDIVECNLKGKIFCRDGASGTDNADLFYKKMGNIVDKLLEKGGYIDGYQQAGEVTDK